MSATTTANGRPVVELLALSRIHESPLNPRKTFLEVEELAEDLKKRGLLQPVLVRPKGDDFELVFGARRYRAAQLAGLEELPAMVREMNDELALETQIVENSKRVDVHPLEEGEGYKRLHTKFKMSAEEIAAKVGKSRAAVYERMKLCELIEPAKKAFYAGDLTASTALYLARVPATIQPQALKDLTSKGYREEIPSAREAHRIITDRYMLRLADAPFDRGDTQLVAEAGACKDCPKRTGNQKELFADVSSPDVCTDPSCFDKKRKAHAAQESKRLAAKGVKVLAGERDKWGQIEPPRGYVPLDHYDYSTGGRASETIAKATKKGFEAPAGMTVYANAKGEQVKVVSQATLTAAAKHAELGKYAPARAPRSGQPGERKRKPDELAKDKAFARVKDAIVGHVRKQGIDDAALLFLSQEYLYGPAKRVEKLSGKKLAAAVVEIAVESDRWNWQDGSELAKLCKAYKIDAKGIEAEELARLTPAKKKPSR